MITLDASDLHVLLETEFRIYQVAKSINEMQETLDKLHTQKCNLICEKTKLENKLNIKLETPNEI